MLLDFKLGTTGVILRIKLRNSSVTTGAGLTGLTNASAGLVISTIADNEATATAYTQAGGTIQGITTLGTYAAPSASNCRFKEVDATNHPGLYEVQFADARLNVTSARSLVVSFSGATNLAQCDVCIPLRQVDPYDGVAFGLSRIDAAISSRSTYAGGAVASVTAAVSLNLAQTGLTPRALDAVADSALTVGDALVAAVCAAAGRETVVGTAYTVMSPSTGTVIRTFTLNSSTTPTSRT